MDEAMSGDVQAGVFCNCMANIMTWRSAQRQMRYSRNVLISRIAYGTLELVAKLLSSLQLLG